MNNCAACHQVILSHGGHVKDVQMQSMSLPLECVFVCVCFYLCVCVCFYLCVCVEGACPNWS